ncbi:MAG: PEP-CTERM sorting domain-containing protein [Verrucomicrobiae bacterium]|nr:PEP-CTERM sorting domain-containing protein [Verrucomicrobiae bacterium]
MKPLLLKLSLALALFLAADQSRAQGTFQNLDFENGIFIPIADDPFGRVQFGPAMPGWTGYLGTNQIDWILHNNQFLSTAGIAIYGPDNPSADFLHGHYFLILQSGLDPVGGTGIVTPAIVQFGTIPSSARSIRLLNGNPFTVGTFVFFNGTPVPLYQLVNNPNGSQMWGGDISAFSGQSGELRLLGADYLDYIQFSDEPIPEPGVLGLFALGSLLLAWRWRQNQKS